MHSISILSVTSIYSDKSLPLNDSVISLPILIGFNVVSSYVIVTPLTDVNRSLYVSNNKNHLIGVIQQSGKTIHQPYYHKHVNNKHTLIIIY